MNEKDAVSLKEAGPSLTEEDLQKVNREFRAFIFRRKSTREIWATCCRQHKKGCEMYVSMSDLQQDMPGTGKWSEEHQRMETIFAVPHGPEPNSRYGYPKDYSSMIKCPFCGAVATVKDLGRTGKRYNLCSYKKVFILKWFEGALWAIVWEFQKEYTEALTDLPRGRWLGTYKFEPGLAQGRTSWAEMRQDGLLRNSRWHVWDLPTSGGLGYDAILGTEELKKSPFKYCFGPETLKKAIYPAKLLTACCFYPRQIEMMLKIGLENTVRDLVESEKKHATVINWDTNDPKKIFRLQKHEVRQFMQTDKDIQTPELYLKFKRRVPMEECAVMISKGLEMEQLFALAKKWNIEPVKLARYLRRFVLDGSNGSFVRYGQVISCWKDYLTAAQALQEPLHRDNVLMPPNLPQAHEDATERHRLRLEQERAARDRERQAILDKQKLKREQKLAQARREYAERRKKLEEKYVFALDGYEIMVPQNEDEIVAEGIALKHCVAGYASRHIEGKLTILFMRKSTEPEVPWLTIEMNGNAMRQIHGYKNEGLYSANGRFAPDPREVYAEWLDTWLAWLKAGSKRNEDGTPKLPKKKGAAA